VRPELIAVIAMLIAVPGIIVTLVAVHRRQVGARQEAAERLGLAYVRDREGFEGGRVLGGIQVRSKDRLVGTWRGRQARIDFARQSHGGHGSKDYTRAVLEGGAPPGVTLFVRRNSVGARLAEAVGLARDLKIGDDALDRAWQIQGSPEDAALAMVGNPAVRAGLGRDAATAAVIARNGRLELLVRKTVRDAEHMRAILDLASDLADAVSSR
jgi:hypothetical protein